MRSSYTAALTISAAFIILFGVGCDAKTGKQHDNYKKIVVLMTNNPPGLGTLEVRQLANEILGAPSEFCDVDSVGTGKIVEQSTNWLTPSKFKWTISYTPAKETWAVSREGEQTLLRLAYYRPASDEIAKEFSLKKGFFFRLLGPTRLDGNTRTVDRIFFFDSDKDGIVDFYVGAFRDLYNWAPIGGEYQSYFHPLEVGILEPGWPTNKVPPTTAGSTN